MEYYFRKKDDLPSIPELPDPFEKPDGSRVMTPRNGLPNGNISKNCLPITCTDICLKIPA